MGHEGEYHDGMIALLELVWGEGFMAPGGPGNVARMVEGLDVRDRLVLDIGSGLGGPATALAQDFGARVVGLDLEAPLVTRASARALALGLEDQVRFEVVYGGPLPFEDRSQISPTRRSRSDPYQASIWSLAGARWPHPASSSESCPRDRAIEVAQVAGVGTASANQVVIDGLRDAVTAGNGVQARDATRMARVPGTGDRVRELRMARARRRRGHAPAH